MNPLIRTHRFHLSIQQYHAQGKQNLFPEIDDCPQPGCSYRGRLRKNGFYSRQAITPRRLYAIWIQRYRCPHCGRTVSMLPSFVLPHYQYTLAALFWILTVWGAFHFTSQVAVARWRRRNTQVPEFGHRHVRRLRRRLRDTAPLIRLTLGVDASEPIETQLIRRLRCTGDLEAFSRDFEARWQRAFLAPPITA